MLLASFGVYCNGPLRCCLVLYPLLVLTQPMLMLHLLTEMLTDYYCIEMEKPYMNP
jgi:hypothetical protein